MTAPARPYRVAADIGGTFTDIACLSPDGTLSTCKVPSTPDDYARAVLTGLETLIGDMGLDRACFVEVLHASTIATNAILEGKGAVTALLTTEGFRDVLELRRIRVPRLYEPLYEKPRPLVPRRRRFEVAERTGPKGDVIRPLDIDGVQRLVQSLAVHPGDGPLEAVAVCFLHSFANPAHEQAVAALLRQALPGVFVCISSDVLPEIREYERTSTTVINAYIGPPVRRYLQSLQTRLRGAGFTGRVLMMQSSGGTLDAERVMTMPVKVVESGPAAGVIGAAWLGVAAGYRNLITFDMGGTTAKASLIEDGALIRTDEYEVGGGISLSSRLAKGAGYALKLPVIDISEVGAGGGSIVWLDAAGALKVGPHSAGASPGPVCYGTGGTQPTVTDANVMLGFLNQQSLAGGVIQVHAALARAALETTVARPLGLDLMEAAYGVHRVANAAMMRAVKTVSTYRGRDPRDFTLFAFGGNGGIHAAELAQELQIRRILVPPAAGVFSAVGLLFADFEIAQSQAYLQPVGTITGAGLTAAFRALEQKVQDELAAAAPAAQLIWRADLRYGGQAFELSVPVSPPHEGLDLTPEAIAAVAEAFECEHERTYGHRSSREAVEFVVLRVIGTLAPEGTRTVARIAPHAATAGPAKNRPVYFGPRHGLHDTPVIARQALGAEAAPGPIVIEDYEGTTIVPPGATVRLEASGMLVIDLEEME